MCRSFLTWRMPFVVAPIIPVLWVHVVGAAITTSGDITPDPIEPLDTTAELRIGVGSDPDDIDPRAAVTVDGGSLLDIHQVFVGYDTGYFGRMNVSGSGTRVQLGDGGANSDAALEIGRRGNGYFSLTDGATLWLTNNSGDIAIGSDAGSVGTMEVDGGHTFVTLKEDILVGDAGFGSLAISGGALVRTTDNRSVVSVGDKATASGVLTVDGPLTTFQLGHNLTVGNLGVGEMVVSGGALVDADNTTTAQATVGTLGKIKLSDGTLNVRDIDVSGYLGGSGIVMGQVDVGATGLLEAESGDLLDFHDAVSNVGAVTITEGEARFLDAMANNVGGRITLEDSVVRFSQALTNDGIIASAEGANNIHGPITNNGTVVVASESVAIFNDAYTDNGTTTVLARGNALFLSDLTFTSNSILSLELSSEEAENSSSQVEVAGAATLAGQLAVAIDPNFAPVASQSYELFHADGGITGEFIPPIFPNAEGVRFGLTYSANGLMLDVLVDVPLAGDFNDDGLVDGADFLSWQRGQSPDPLSADDLALWETAFGSSDSISYSTNIPEPSSIVLLLTALAYSMPRGRAVTISVDA